MTAMQRRVLQFLADFQRRNGSMPTMAEVARAMGWRSANAAHDHIAALERRGAVTRKPGTARCVRLTPAGRRALGLAAAADSPAMLRLPVYEMRPGVRLP